LSALKKLHSRVYTTVVSQIAQYYNDKLVLSLIWYLLPFRLERLYLRIEFVSVTISRMPFEYSNNLYFYQIVGRH
jgi:hypothetical protein